MNFDKDYKEFIEWGKTKGGIWGPTEFTVEEDVSIRLFVAYLNCRYANVATDDEELCHCRENFSLTRLRCNICTKSIYPRRR